MASAGNPYDRFRKILECSICLDVYKDPKTLKCAHEFCQYCLEDILVFQDDGSVTITCPLRCKENTVLNNDQTTNDLATPYTIKSMLDTLEEDTGPNTKADGKPLCTVYENCRKCISVYCCGTIMCRTCLSDHLKASGTDDPHEKWKLTFSVRESKLRVLCEKHLIRCTHVCDEDDQFLCVYCLYRDAKHKDHKVKTVEEAAEFIRTVVRKELQHSQWTEKSLLKTVVSVKNAKKSLKEVLKQRKNNMVLKDQSSLDSEVTRLMELFEGISDSHLRECGKDIATTQYCAELIEKLDFELIGQKKFVLDMVTGLSSRPFNGVSVSLTDSCCDSATPLGNIYTAVVDATPSQSSLNCDWVDPESGKTQASVVKMPTDNGDQCVMFPNYDQGVCKSFEQLSTAAADSMEDHSAKSMAANSNNPDRIAALPSVIGVDSSCIDAEFEDVSAACNLDLKSSHITTACKLDIPNFSQGTANELKLQGNIYFKQRQYVKAIECYSQAISICSPEDQSKPVYHQNRAAANEQLKNWCAVVEDCSIALELDPIFTKALIRRSRAHEMLGHMREAYEDITFVHGIEGANGIDRPETIESLRRTINVLSSALAEQQRQRHFPSMLPAQHILRSVIQTFNYDPFTIPLSTSDRDSNYSEILRNLKKGKYGNVMKFCDKEIASQGWHRDRALLLRGFIKYCMSDDTTIFDFYGVLEFPKNKTNALLHLTAQLMIANRQLFVEGDIPGGMFFLESAQGMGIEKATVLSQEGTIHKHAKRMDEAKRCFNAAISLDGRFLEPRLQLACILMEEATTDTSLSEKVEKAMTDFVHDFPHCHKSWLLYGTFLLGVERYEEAIEKLDKAMMLDPNSPEAFSCKARCLNKQYAKADEAESLWLKAIKIDKRNGDAYMELGYLEFRRIRWEAAYKYLLRAVEILAHDVSKTRACYNWMEYMNAKGKYCEAMDKYNAKKEGCSDSKENAVKSSHADT